MSEVLRTSEIPVKSYTRGTNNAYTFYQTVILNSQSIENNTSNITVIYSARGNNYNYYLFKSPTATVNVYDSRTNSMNYKTSRVVTEINPKNTTVEICSWTGDIQHKDDGTLEIAVDTIYNPNTSAYEYLPAAHTLSSGTIPVRQIHRASNPSIENDIKEVILGNSITIKTNKLGDFTHKLTCVIDDYVETIGTSIVNTKTWTPSIELLNHIPTATDGKKDCVIKCETFYNGSSIGIKSIPITLVVPSDIKPTISSVVITDVGEDIVNNNLVDILDGTYVQGKSKLKFQITANSPYNCEIASYKVIGVENQLLNKSTNIIISDILNEVADNKSLTIRVTDKRGMPEEYTTDYSCYEYKEPQIGKVDVSRSDPNGVKNDEGEYLNYTFPASVSSLNGKNYGEYSILYKSVSENSYESEVIDSGKLAIDYKDAVLNPKVPYSFINTTRYNIRFMVTDIFNVPVVLDRTLETVPDLINFNASGKALAIGKVSEAGEDEKKLEIAMDTEITGKLKVNGNEVLSFTFIEEE